MQPSFKTERFHNSDEEAQKLRSIENTNIKKITNTKNKNQIQPSLKTASFHFWCDEQKVAQKFRNVKILFR